MKCPVPDNFTITFEKSLWKLHVKGSKNVTKIFEKHLVLIWLHFSCFIGIEFVQLCYCFTLNWCFDKLWVTEIKHESDRKKNHWLQLLVVVSRKKCWEKSVQSLKLLKEFRFPENGNITYVFGWKYVYLLSIFLYLIFAFFSFVFFTCCFFLSGFSFTNIQDSQGSRRGVGLGYLLNSSLPLPPASQTLRH